MASKTALPIARLRSLGCRVGTVIGHNPAISDFIYGVTLPKGIELPLATSKFRGSARADMARGSKSRIIVKACSYRMGEPLPGREVRERNEADVAGLLNAIADALSKAGRS